MPLPLRRTVSVMLASLFAAAPFAALPGAADAAVHVKPGIYDCWAYSVYGFVYGGSYKFSTPGRYQYAGLSKNGQLVGKIDSGAYKLHGRKLIPTSGPMKKNHLYLVEKNSREWTMWNAGSHKPTGIGCYWKKAK